MMCLFNESNLKTYRNSGLEYYINDTILKIYIKDLSFRDTSNLQTYIFFIFI